MSQHSLKNKQQAGRFAVVGIVNTIIDFVLLFILKYLGLPAVAANTLSSTAAFIFSYVANKNYTFKASDQNHTRQIILFIIVTLIGLWVIQNLIILLTEELFIDLLQNSSLGLLASKLLATVVSMIWNYTLYAKVVFKPDLRIE